ncbi:MAG: glycosyltransferase [Gammaproteobacteria bacterium]
MHIIVILGMHRSGTSAVARVCNLLGAQIGEQLMPPSEGNNPAGFWELDEVRVIHDELLQARGSSWDATAPLPANWWRNSVVSEFRDRLIHVVREEFAGAALACLKDPRMCRLMPLWKGIFDEIKWEPHYLLPVRNPLDVARSLSARDGLHHCQSHLLWLRHVLEAERWTRGQPRAYVSYEQLMADWRAAMTPAWRQLGLDELTVDPSTSREIDSFLQTDLRHHASSRDDLDNDERLTLIRRVYDDYASTISDDQSQGSTALSALEKTLTEASFLFGAVIDDARTQKTALATEWHSANLRINAATGKINKLRHELANVTQQSTSRLAEINQLSHELANVTQQAASRLAEINHLQDIVAVRDGALREQASTITSLAGAITALQSSTSWRVTAPLRGVKTGLQSCAGALRGPLARSLRWVFDRFPMSYNNKLRLKAHAVALSPRVGEFPKDAASSASNRKYQDWIKANDTLDDDDRAAIKRHIATLARKPLISVIMPVFNPPERFLRSAIQSVLDQLYDHWELCIADDCSTEPYVAGVLREYEGKDRRIKVVVRTENGNISACSNSAIALATGDYFALLDHDDALPEKSLYTVAVAINKHPSANIIYSDEDKIDEHDKRNTPYFKTDWNPDLFYGQNIINHLGVYRASAVKEISGFRLGFEGSQDYDLALRIIERSAPRDIVHIPEILYHWRNTSAAASFSQSQRARAVTAAHTAIREHFARLDIDAEVETAPDSPHYQRIRRSVPQPAPLVSLIIPTKDKVDLLQQCIDSILFKTTYSPLEVIIVDNGSVEPETHAYLTSVSVDSRVQVIDYGQAFNYSAINNFAMRQARGDIIGLINNDIVVINEDWLTELVSHAVRPEVGAVGAMLYYPDDTVQHAGVILGIGGVAGHSHKHVPRGHHGYFDRLTLVQSVSAVTGACLLMRREIIDECGGLDEENLKIAFNDVDLCLRIRALGYRIIWTPHAELYHLESASRGTDTAPEKIERFAREVLWMKDHWGDTLLQDPYYSPNLTLDREDFTLAHETRASRPWINFLTELTSSGERHHAAALEGKQNG